MVRVLVCAGLYLDRAWPELAPGGGRERRERARRLLIEVVRSAREASVDAIAIIGGLFDRRTVMPATLQQAASAFAAFEGLVFIVPGTADWHDDHSPYALMDWPKNVRVLAGAASIAELDADLSVAGVPANSSAGGHRPAGEADVVLVGGGPELDVGTLDAVRPQGGSVVVVGGAVTKRDGPVVHVGPLLPSPGEAAARAAIIEVHTDGLQSVDTAAPDGVAVPSSTIDVTNIESTEALLHAVREVLDEHDDVAVLRIGGELRRGVVLPGFVDVEAIGSVAVDLTSLRYELVVPEADGGGALVEFEAGVVRDDGLDKVRHQAVALGLRALEAGDA